MLSSRFTSGWPWPDESWGMSPVYGADGWCRACGVPKHEQTGSLVMRASKFPTSAFWMPNWLFDRLCVRLPDALAVIDAYALRTLPVVKPKATTDVVSLLPVLTQSPWFDASALARAVGARHGHTGSRCDACGVWRWFPLPFDELPDPGLAHVADDVHLVSSPEWFGDGMSARREIRARRPLAEALAALNPRVWKLLS